METPKKDKTSPRKHSTILSRCLRNRKEITSDQRDLEKSKAESTNSPKVAEGTAFRPNESSRRSLVRQSSRRTTLASQTLFGLILEVRELRIIAVVFVVVGTGVLLDHPEQAKNDMLDGNSVDDLFIRVLHVGKLDWTSAAQVWMAVIEFGENLQ